MFWSMKIILEVRMRDTPAPPWDKCVVTDCKEDLLLLPIAIMVSTCVQVALERNKANSEHEEQELAS